MQFVFVEGVEDALSSVGGLENGTVGLIDIVAHVAAEASDVPRGGWVVGGVEPADKLLKESEAVELEGLS